MNTEYCKIANDLIADCEKPPVSGSKKRVIILPRRIVKDWTLNETNPIKVESITRTDDGTNYDKGYQYITDKALHPAHEKVEDDFGVGYIHRLPFPVKGLTAATRWELAKLAREGDGVIAIVEQNYREGDSKWRVMGLNTGLFVEQDNDENNSNISDLILASKEDAPEPFSAQHFFDTDYETTDAAIEDLLEATEVPA